MVQVLQLAIQTAPDLFDHTTPDLFDHEVRIIVDGEDWLGTEQLGLDPPDLRTELTKSLPDHLRVGRCTCGQVGCSDVEVLVTRTPGQVRWTTWDERELVFHGGQYDTEIARFAGDHSWEPLGRRVERLVGALFWGATTRDGYAFTWASTRIKPGRVSLYFTKGNSWQMPEFGWDGVAEETALSGAKAFLRDELSRI